MYNCKSTPCSDDSFHGKKPSLDSAGTHVALRLPHRATRVRAGRLRNGKNGPRAKWA